MRHLAARRAAAVMALALVAGAVQGCASDSLRRNSYKMLGSYTVALETAADVAENPATPTEVVDGIKQAKDAASPAVRLLHANMRNYADLQDQIQGIRDAGGEPEAIVLAQLEAALLALQSSMAETAPLIAQILTAVRAF